MHGRAGAVLDPKPLLQMREQGNSEFYRSFLKSRQACPEEKIPWVLVRLSSEGEHARAMKVLCSMRKGGAEIGNALEWSLIFMDRRCRNLDELRWGLRDRMYGNLTDAREENLVGVLRGLGKAHEATCGRMEMLFGRLARLQGYAVRTEWIKKKIEAPD
ncbi:Uncharacterised protein [uncultured archaeon]|nr:Uncharacterised protein [uncultured archaeon]